MKRPAFLLASLIVVGIVLPFTPTLGDWLHSLVGHRPYAVAISRFPFWICVVLLAFLLYRLALTVLTSRGAGGAWVRELHERCIGGTLWEIYRRRLFPEKRLGLLTGIWAILIVAIVGALYSAGAMDNSELPLLRVGFAPANQDSMPIVRSFSYYSADRDPITYLRDLATISRHLQDAGARLIVAEDPMYFVTHDSVLLGTIVALKDSLRRAGVLLHEPKEPSWYWHDVDRRPSIDTASFRSTEAALSVLVRPSEDYWRDPPRWYPAQYRHATPQIDLGLLVAARLLGLPDTVSVRVRPGKVNYGSLEISTDMKGMAIPLTLATPHHIHLDVTADRELRSDTLWFTHFRFQEFKMERLLEFPAKGVADARGAIVLIDWWFWPDEGIPSLEYAGVVSSLLHGTVARRYGSAPLWISALVVGLSLWLALKVRLRYAVPLILLLAAGLFFGGVWLLFQHSIMLDAAYPAVAAVLSGITFPLVRWSHEHP